MFSQDNYSIVTPRHVNVSVAIVIAIKEKCEITFCPQIIRGLLNETGLKPSNSALKS